MHQLTLLQPSGFVVTLPIAIVPDEHGWIFSGTAPAVDFNADTLRLHLFFDRSSVDTFAEGGITCRTETFFPTSDFDLLVLKTEGGAVEILSGTIHQLRPAHFFHSD